MRIRPYADVAWKDILGKHPEQKEKKDLYTSVTGFTAKRTDHFVAAACTAFPGAHEKAHGTAMSVREAPISVHSSSLAQVPSVVMCVGIVPRVYCRTRP
eukprot:3681482-Rhodomonas_salina.1